VRCREQIFAGRKKEGCAYLTRTQTAPPGAILIVAHTRNDGYLPRTYKVVISHQGKGARSFSNLI